jgi:hypothetical protein
MTTYEVTRCVGLCLSVAVAITAAGLAQNDGVGNPFTGQTVVGAPFTADATTTIRKMHRDGSLIDRRATARYYRDRTGRVRVEQPLSDPGSTSVSGELRVTIQPDPAQSAVYTVNDATRTKRLCGRGCADSAIGGGDTFSVPLGGIRFLVFARGEALRQRIGLIDHPVEEESLGSRRISGVEVVGRRTTDTILPGVLGNDRAEHVVDERWESPELKLLISARHADPTGVMEYAVTNISRTEPRPDLFVVPDDYEVVRGDKDDWISLEFGDPVKGAKILSARWR